MKDIQAIYEQMLNKKYYSSNELIYDNQVGIFMSHYEYNQLLSYKDSLIKNNERLLDLSALKSFNNYPLHLAFSLELNTLENTYYNALIDDFENTNEQFSLRHIDDITLSRIYSEIEGTLNIESVPTTRKVVVEIAKGTRDPKTNNEVIIDNMIKCIDFVNKCPDFNKENLFRLYNILSKDCLDEEDKLPINKFYRDDGVEVGGYNGCPFEKIEECMDSLFDFINDNLKNKDLIFYLPHIAHYYVVYIHPYFDYNGRTARMVSYWVSLLSNSNVMPPIISEAINQSKRKYYSALKETRDSHNDLTYFLTYLFDTSIKYFLTYKNLDEICVQMQNNGFILTSLEKVYFKKILISNKGKFTYDDFTKWIGVEMTKQGALKILNTFEKYGLLTSMMSNSNKKLFEVNNKYIRYNTK